MCVPHTKIRYLNTPLDRFTKNMARPNTPTQFLKIYIFQHRIIYQITPYPIILGVTKCYLFIAVIVYWIRLPWAQHNYVVQVHSQENVICISFYLWIWNYGILTLEFVIYYNFIIVFWYSPTVPEYSLLITTEYPEPEKWYSGQP